MGVKWLLTAGHLALLMHNGLALDGHPHDGDVQQQANGHHQLADEQLTHSNRIQGLHPSSVFIENVE
jgi:hypothetical protein